MSTARPAGLRLIIAYKAIKSILQLIVAGVLLYGLRHGLAASLTRFAQHLRQHAVHGWSEVFAAALLRFLDHPHELLLTAGALAGDAVVSGIEGWVLLRGYSWGPWLVVGATGSLLPFEAVSFLRSPHLGRLLLLVINTAVVVYLVRRVRRRAAGRSQVTTN